MKLTKLGLLSASIALILSGCNSDDSSSGTTPVTLSVSDAPVDEVSQVVVTYSKVAFLPLGSDKPILFDVYKTDDEGNPVDENGNPLPDGEDPIPLSVNLLDFQGGDAQELIENQNIPTGDYKLCLFANDGDHPTYPSYVEAVGTGNHPLTVQGEGKCPQGVGSIDNAGVLYFNDTFTVNNDNNDYVVEFDLRRGLKEPKNSSDTYTIQRTSVALVNTTEVGEIAGNVAGSTMGTCESSTSSSAYSHAVYLYEGNVTQAEMDSFAGNSNTVAPITAANVTLDGDGVTYEYEFGFVKPGTYSVGYTCTANNDSEEGLTGNFDIHAANSGLSVIAGSETTVNF
ncbi:DUF4382 domain-containing protein [Vibrio hepatarius]|uniref:DUF4382 domain-containing protein n=1 Tax=Vibrio hepatarius TaxID=171383 RepID=UPI003734E6F9